jgi:hypothetical protein
MCHCDDCQRRTGSAFSVAVFYARAQVRLASGATATFAREAANGAQVTFRFCPSCGSNVYWEPARMPDLIGVALGCFAEPDFPPPSQSVWTKYKHRWLALPNEMPAFEGAPPPRI